MPWTVWKTGRAQGGALPPEALEGYIPGAEKGDLPFVPIDVDGHLGAIIVFGSSESQATERARRIVDAIARENAIIELGHAVAEAEKESGHWWPGWCHVLFEKAFNVIQPGRFK